MVVVILSRLTILRNLKYLMIVISNTLLNIYHTFHSYASYDSHNKHLLIILNFAINNAYHSIL
jgi:hypothetical protein